MLTRALVAAIAVLVVAGLWRLARWHWRPKLRLPDAPTVSRDEDGIRLSVVVRNEGAGRSRRCRARLIRAEREEGGAWLRIEAPVAPSAEPVPAKTGIPPDGTATLSVSRLLPPEPGRYRVEVAVINGEEVRASYVIDIEAADTPPSS